MPTPQRLLTKGAMCAYLGGISPATYASWQAKGIVPGPVPGTNRFDICAHDAWLDRITGLADAEGLESRKSAVNEWADLEE